MNQLLFLVTKALQKPCRDVKILCSQLKVGMLKFSEKINPHIAEIKESNPIEVTEAAISFKHDMEPELNWLVQKVIKKRDQIIGKLHVATCSKGKMKFCIDIPGTVKDAVSIDEDNGNTLWKNAIKLEMKNSRVDFKICEKVEKTLVGHTKITCRIIFDLKLDMTQKSQQVAVGQLTNASTYMYYSSVVSRDIAFIGFLIAALKNLDILARDIHNFFFESPTKQKIFFYAGDEWKADKDKVVIIVRELYGIKYSALQFCNCLAETLRNRLSYKSFISDPDLWYKPMTDADGFEYYAYILVYVDYLSLIMKYSKGDMAHIRQRFTVKTYNIKELKSYLLADIKNIYYSDGPYEWKIGAETYVTHAIKNLKKRMKTEGFDNNKNLSNVDYSPQQPFSNLKYCPEFYVTDECSYIQIQLFQNIIGTMQ